MTIRAQTDEAIRLANEHPPYLTIDDAAALAHCDQSTLRRAIRAGSLLAFRPAQRLLFREADVREWVESRPARVSVEPRPRAARRRRVEPGSVQALREMERAAGR